MSKSSFASNATGCGGVLGILSGGFAAYLIIFLILGLIFAAPVEFTSEYWLSYLKEKPVDIPFWACIIAATIPPVTMFVGIIGGSVTLIASFAIENPYYIPN